LYISERVRRECEEKLTDRLRKDAGVPPLELFQADKFSMPAFPTTKPFAKAAK